MNETKPKYQFTDDMREISGFGGGYEQCCRDMVLAGVKWFDEHPTAKPSFKGFKNVYGLIMDDNEDAKALSKAVVDAANGDCTGAMHQASISHVMRIKQVGWEQYCAESRKLEAGEKAKSGVDTPAPKV